MPDQNACSRPATPAQTLGLHPEDRSATATAAHEGVARSHEHRIERLIGRLPNRITADHPLATPAVIAVGEDPGGRAADWRRHPERSTASWDLDAAAGGDAAGGGFATAAPGARSRSGLDSASPAPLVR